MTALWHAAALTLIWLIMPGLFGAALLLAGASARRADVVSSVATIVGEALLLWRLGMPLFAPPRTGAAWLLALAGALFCYGALFWQRSRMPQTADGSGALAVAVLGPLDEELWFRGVIFSRVLGVSLAGAALSSVLFALVHVVNVLAGRAHRRTLWLDVSGDAVFAFLTAAAMAVSGTLLVALLLHAFVNMLSLRAGARAA